MAKRWVFKCELNVSLRDEKIVVYTDDDVEADEAAQHALEVYEEKLRNDISEYIDPYVHQCTRRSEDIYDGDAFELIEIGDHLDNTEEPVQLMFSDVPVQLA